MSVKQVDLVEDVAFDDESVKGPNVSFFKGQTKDAVYRIAVASTKFKIVQTHFVDGFGQVMCRTPRVKEGEVVQKALCCKKLKDPSVRCGLVIVKYTTDPQGSLLKPPSYMLMAWIFGGREKLSNLRGINEDYPLTKHDLKVTCTDVDWQKFTFLPTPECLWQKEQLGWIQDIKQGAAELEKVLPQFMGKVLEDEEILELVKKSGKGGSEEAGKSDSKTASPQGSAAVVGEDSDLASVLENL